MSDKKPFRHPPLYPNKTYGGSPGSLGDVKGFNSFTVVKEGSRFEMSIITKVEYRKRNGEEFTQSYQYKGNSLQTELTS